MATAQVLPKELRLSAPPTMPQARSYLFKQQSTQTSYSTSQSVIQINIPRLQRSYLTKDSYLSFRLVAPSTAVACATSGVLFDTPGAFGVIDKIEVYDYLGSTLLESTSGHGQLMALLMDIDTSPNEIGTHYNVTSGTDNIPINIVDATVGADGSTAGTLVNHIKNRLNNKNTSGSVLQTHGAGKEIPANAIYEYAIPLFSFLGLLSSKFVPLHNGFTIMITLNPTARYIGSIDNAFEFTVANVFMNCQVLELGPTAESMLLSSSNGQPLVIPAKAYRRYVSNYPAGTSDWRIDLNLNVASLTNVLWTMRASDMISTETHKQRTLSYRIRNYLKSWYFQYGSSILPQTSGIQCRSLALVQNGGSDEAYIELMKSRHGFHQDTYSSQITKTTFNVDKWNATNHNLSTTNVNPTGRFAAGIDLELVPGRSQNLICGMNTNGMNTSIMATFDLAAAAADSGTCVAANIDVWCEYDAFINISPGIASTVSF